MKTYPRSKERQGVFVPVLLSLLATVSFPIHSKAQNPEWLSAAQRFKGTYNASAIGNMGLQFQQVVTWNLGTSDPSKRGWIVTGQDENGVRVSYDYGATWSSPRLSGLFCSKMAGLYLDTDDDLFVAMGGEFGIQEFGEMADVQGIFKGDGSLGWVKRVEITRPSGPGPYVSGSSGPKRAFTKVNYAGNSVVRSSNFLARRPQVKTGTPLTDAQRPIYALEQVRAADGNSFDYMAIFKSTDAGASFSLVRELSPSTYASGKNGLFHILVAKNGDVVILGAAGLWLSTDEGTSFTKKHPASGNLDIAAGAFYSGDASTPSGMRIGIHSASVSGGVWQSTNIRTGAFSKPNGNAGLPANYMVRHLGASPVNENRMAVCSYSNGVAAYYSTDGGANFSVVTDYTGVGDEDWRYNIAKGHAGFYFCPTNELKCLVPTFQTMARSIDGAVHSEGDLVAGFDGMHAKGVGFDALNGDWRKILRVCQDSWVNIASDGMHWVASNGLGTGSSSFKTEINNAGGGGNGYVSGASGVICPNNRVIAAANSNTAGQTNVMVILELDANGETTSHTIARSGTTTRAAHSRRSQKNADVAFVGRWAISNLAASNPADVLFTDHSSHEIFDCFLDGNTLISYWANVTTGGSDDGTAIYRSTDDTGSNNQSSAWYTLPTSSFAARAICADYHSTERVLYVRSANRDEIREIKRVGGSFQDNVLVNLRTMTGGILDVLQGEMGSSVTVPANATAITQLIADPNQPGVFYAIAGLHGMPNWWRTVDNGVTWSNFSGNAPRTLWTGVVHPLTGDVMGFSSMGEYIHRSPTIYPSLSNRDALSNQNSDYKALRPTITTTSLPDAVVGSAYNQTLAATGGNGTKTWSLAAGSLPAGLSLSAGGVISGTPTTTEAKTFDIKVADSDGIIGPIDEDIQTLTIAAANLPIVQASSAPTIDGTIDSVWSQASSKPIANLLSGTVSGSSDLSGSFRTLWDTTNLYVLVVVADDVQRNDSGSTIWYDDCVELYLDANNDKLTSYGATDFRFYFAWNGSSVAIQEAAHNSTSGVNATRAAVTGGYVMEISIPWATLQQANVAVGAPLGVDVHVDDDDDGGGRDGKLAWYNTADTSWQNPSTFATARLDGIPANIAPTITDIADQAVVEDGSTGALAFIVGDAETAAGSLIVSGSSSNQALVPDANISFGGSGASRTVTVTPVADASGSASITITVSDGTFTADDSFVVTVNSANDAPSFTKGANQAVTAGDGAQTVTGWATGISAGPANESGQAVDFIVSNNNNLLFTAQPAVSSTGTLSYTPVITLGSTTIATVTVKAHDNGGTLSGGVDTSTGQTFTITVNPNPIGVFGANEDIGVPGLAGSASYNGTTGEYTVTGGGTDIYGTSDKFRFVHQPWTGDGRIIARVTAVENTNAWAKAGVMFRESTAADAKNVDLILSATNGTQFLYRSTTGGSTQYNVVVPGISAPYWLKLERHESTFTGWQSPDGLSWFLTDATTFTMNSVAEIGLAVTAHNNADLNTSTFDNISVTDVPVWTAADVGSPGATGSSAVDYGTDTYTINGAGANIYGANDAFHFYYQEWTAGDVTIVADMISLTGTNQYAKAGLMIRQSLVSNSVHATVDVTPTSGIEMLTRTTSPGNGTQQTPVVSGGAARFLKLARSGNTFTAYQAGTDGVWSQVGQSVAITMTGSVYVGLVSCSHISGTLSTATFESVFVK